MIGQVRSRQNLSDEEKRAAYNMRSGLGKNLIKGQKKVSRALGQFEKCREMSEEIGYTIGVQISESDISRSYGTILNKADEERKCKNSTINE